ncbi:MAG: type II secretion system protein GspG [Acidobacteria bacterium]|nr:type II secretion system protein GspG [Acidobacteriota bacterium]MCK6682172.1 type II secretion system protein GspG [Thermoanaerobaculia bacterium]
MEENGPVLTTETHAPGRTGTARIVVLAVTVGFGGFVVGVAIPNIRAAAERSKVRETMWKMHSIATAWESLATDHDSYCPRGHAISRYRWDNISGDTLRRWVEPTYIKSFPLTDAWGRPFQFAVECGEPKQGSYAIRSMGRDGIWFDDPQYEGSGVATDYDIVFANGGFFLGDRAYRALEGRSGQKGGGQQ